MAADPLVAIFGEHESIRPRLRGFERALDTAMNRQNVSDVELAVFRDTLNFLRGNVERHMRLEESALLPVLEAKVGRFGTLVSVIAYDHDEVRRETEKLADALAALERAAAQPHRPQLAEVNRHGIFLVQYLGLHMAKEDSALADAAREALGEAGLREVARRLESIK